MNGSTFARYSRLDSEAEYDRQPYVAFALGVQGRRERRLMLQFANGTVGILSYAYLLEVVSTSHQFISLLFTNCIVTLEGRNLGVLLSPLQDEKVRVLQCFNITLHLEATEQDPVIVALKREGLGQGKGRP